MLENTRSNKTLNFNKIINIILVISVVAGFAVSCFISSRLNDSNAVSLINIASLLRFLSGSKNQMVTDIALHNLSIAVFSFILSFLSHGIIGCAFLLFNSFVLGTVLYRVHTPYTVLFVLLELLGICISVFGGTSLASRKHDLTVVFKYSVVLIIVMAVVYFSAAFIESGLIISRWR